MGKSLNKTDSPENRKPLLRIIERGCIQGLDFFKYTDKPRVFYSRHDNLMVQFLQNFMKAFLRVTSSFWLVTGLARPVNGTPPKPMDFAANGWSGGHNRINAPALYLFATILSATFSILGAHFWSLAGLAGLVVWPALAIMHFELSGATWADWSAQLRKIGSRQ